MTVQVIEQDVKAMALRTFLARLVKEPLTVACDSCVADALGLAVSNTAMGSVVHVTIREGWVIRHRNTDVRDHCNNPVSFALTAAGRKRHEILNNR